ncbi:hypothetical protein [Flavobacterium sp. RS13.1]|uniref:hypothetical protein n=1 Tax=Flavobacterium sp. RS13.1 TaxID=3400345 RepID=UPI003AAE582E
MNKLLFFILFIASFNLSAQSLSYSVDVEYYRFAFGCNGTNVPAQTTKTCDINTHRWTLKNAATTVATEILSAANTKKTYSIPLASSYTLSAQSICACSGGIPFVPYYQCDVIGNQTIGANATTYNSNTIAQGIENSIKTGDNAAGYSLSPATQICIGTVILKNFRPNGLAMSKPGYDPNPNGVPTPLEIIAGQTLDLVVTKPTSSNNFPSLVYHWQYSLDNQVTWIEVPNTVINGLPTNYVQNPRFTMENILGPDHINHFGTIHFSVGYGNRLFTNVITVDYSPGTLVLKDRKYFPPNCNGDVVKSIVAYFDRDLIQNEILSTLQVIPYPKVNGDTPKFSQSEVTALVYDPETQLYKYTFDLSKADKLENRYYVIEYQSQINGEVKGTLAIGAPFLYEDPTPVKFEIKKADNPICFGDLAEVSIAVTGGTGDYKFYVDGLEKTNPKPLKEADGYYHIRGLIPTAVNSIKVMDGNNCIEKTL